MQIINPYKSISSWSLRLACLLALLWGGAATTYSQGFEKYYGGNNDDDGQTILSLTDGGFLLGGYSESFNPGAYYPYFLKTDKEGRQVWSLTVPGGFQAFIYDGIQLPDGSFAFVGQYQNSGLELPDPYVIRIDQFGKLLWTSILPKAGFNQGQKIAFDAVENALVMVGLTKDVMSNDENLLVIKLDLGGQAIDEFEISSPVKERGDGLVVGADGYYFVGAKFNSLTNSNDGWMVKTDRSGAIIWQQFVGGAENDQLFDIISTHDNNFATTGFVGNNGDVVVRKFSPNGNVIWERTFGNSLIDEGYSIKQASDNGYIVCGRTEVSATDLNILLLRLDSNGNLVWMKDYGRSQTLDEGRDVIIDAQGNITAIGVSAAFSIFINDLTLLRTDAIGNIQSNHIKGKVFVDQDNGCDLDGNELGLKGWIVQAKGARTFYATTDALGNYDMLVDTGAYQVSFLPKNLTWEACVPLYNNVTITSTYNEVSLLFAMQSAEVCTAMEVDLVSSPLTPCQSSSMLVNYSNEGTQIATNAYVEVALDPTLILTSATVPFTFVHGNTFRFDIGTVAINSEGQFSLQIFTPCNTSASRTHVSRATIYPLSSCMTDPNWDMASMKVEGTCEGDTVRFAIKNVGISPQTQALEYIVIEDQVMIRAVPYDDLTPNDSLLVKIATQGSTYRIITNQTNGHPGNSFPTIAVEACQGSGTNVSSGQVTQFEEDERDLFVAVDATQNGSSPARNSLEAYPRGVNQYITNSTALEYMLHFTNEGLDTTNILTIRIPIDPSLDPATFEVGTSTHPVEMEVYEAGAIRLTFKDIRLPGSASSNVLQRSGFVSFRISQKPGIEAGTIISKMAEFTFDGQAPVVSNEVIRIIGGDRFQDFLQLISDTKEPQYSQVHVRVFPNPVVEIATVELLDYSPEGKLTMTITNVQGQEVLAPLSANGKFFIQKGTLPNGIYLFDIRDKGLLIHRGKLMMQ